MHDHSLHADSAASHTGHITFTLFQAAEQHSSAITPHYICVYVCHNQPLLLLLSQVRRVGADSMHDAQHPLSLTAAP